MLMLPKTWPCFLNTVAGTPVLYFCCCSLRHRARGWPWKAATPSSSDPRGERTFHEVLALACRGLQGFMGGSAAWCVGRRLWKQALCMTPHPPHWLCDLLTCGLVVWGPVSLCDNHLPLLNSRIGIQAVEREE